MMNYPKLFMAAIAVAVGLPHATAADVPTLTVSVDRPGARISETMYGVFFEDINFGADGGLYAELVKNRSFEFPDSMMAWRKISGSAEIQDTNPFSAANPHYLRLIPSGGRASIANEGFRGIGLKQGDAYDFSAQIRAVSNAPAIRVELADENGKVVASAQLAAATNAWSRQTVVLTPNSTVQKGHLIVTVDGGGAVDFDMVSLFPQKTWKGRKNGLRADMVQMLADLKPSFLRFPGGCIVEGSDLEKRYQWKTTIGPVEERKLIINRWNYEFRHRPTPDYFQSFGLGFFEFFQVAEDIGAEPMPILNCGMACQFNTGQLVPLDQLDPYVQDALDLIEFANGPVTSTWGAKRAAMGHPEPFNLKMLGIGNEQWGPQFVERYPIFAKAIKAKYPQIQLIAGAGPSPADDRYVYLAPKLAELKVDIIDEHCYGNPIWFLANANRYDNYDRNGPKIFMGEYAGQSVAIVSPDNRNNLECAIAEAAYMTGLERNADVVTMSSYAPLFGHVDAWQWTPNLIWADNLRVQPTPNYYVQQLFSVNRGEMVLPVKLVGVDVNSNPVGGIALGTFNTAAEFRNLAVTANGDTLLKSDFSDDTAGWSTNRGQWRVRDGVLQQTETRAPAAISAGKTDWRDYTLNVQARKNRGAEGFLITVRQVDSENCIVWNLGSFGNRFHSLQHRLGQQDHLKAQVPGSIEPDRWYDIRVQLKGSQVDCFLDDSLVHSIELPPVKTQRLYASATRDEKAGDIILKVVNPGEQVNPLQVHLDGLAQVRAGARATVLTGESGDAVNTLDEPNRIAPRTASVTVNGPRFRYDSPARSLSVIRIPVR
ncbi:MAG TPA: alpha-L-arabinofuranosidase C-terminal domain-containing protein [Verrucomicrobiae bacterium]|nr:alpha-L-arabinofuranosidase C-terminal domain-containing protein [Verrucomicrobiae bacterium]